MKKLIIIFSVILGIIGVLVGVYIYGLSPVSKSSKTVEFVVRSGDGKQSIIENLVTANLIRNKFSAYVYIGLNSNLNLQAGTYEISPNMGVKKIFEKMDLGEVVENTYSVTFIEGKRLVDYASIIASKTNTSQEEVIKIMNDKEYLNELIDKYWFLTEDILNNDIYYPLEGYLFPNTYEVYQDSTVKEIIEKMLDGTLNALNNFKSDIDNSTYSIHELITMASIVELEGVNADDRKGVAGVFYNRINNGWTLGSDATTYYAVNKTFSVDLTNSDLTSCNGYNTRGNCVKGLPVGPICSPSLTSIESAINPSEHDYFFFVADKNKKTYFTKTSSEHTAKVAELKSEGKWYEYN